MTEKKTKRVKKTEYAGNKTLVQVQLTPFDREKIKADAKKRGIKVYAWWNEAARKMLKG